MNKSKQTKERTLKSTNHKYMKKCPTVFSYQRNDNQKCLEIPFYRHTEKKLLLHWGEYRSVHPRLQFVWNSQQ